MMNRRDFLRNGGLAASVVAVLAACGETGPTAPGRLGVAAPSQTLPDGTVNDVVLLRTAQSLHHTAIDVHSTALESSDLPAQAVPALQQIIANHVAASDILGEVIARGGGDGFACANPFWTERFVEPAFAAMDGSDDPVRDVMNIVSSFEEIIARSHQELVTALTQPDYRSPVLAIGLQCTRQAALLAAIAHPEALIQPKLLGEEAIDTDAAGFTILYVIPEEFGQVGGFTLTVGAIDPVEASRFSVNLQTPSDNSYAFEYLACDS